jgi:hypothetical protein
MVVAKTMRWGGRGGWRGAEPSLSLSACGKWCSKYINRRRFRSRSINAVVGGQRMKEFSNMNSEVDWQKKFMV